MSQTISPETTELLGLPYIISSQAQKHVTHNEALRMLDALAQIGVVSRAVAAPPPSPAPGDRYMVPDGGAAAWGAPDGSLLAWQDGAWAAFEPRSGWIAWIADEGALVAHDGSAWRAASGGPAATLGVNATADETNRLTVSAAGTLLTHEGSDHRLSVNKAAPGDTASLVFQSDWNGRAEMGLAGADDWSVKVSPDGATWRESLAADATTGALRFPHGANGAFLQPGIDDAGGGDTVLGPPSMLTIAHRTANLTVAADRVYFSAFLVDRPTELVGAHVAQRTAAGTGAVMRVGVFAFGQPNGNNWDVGDLIADLGTLPADTAGHKAFTSAPVTLQPGWHFMALGVSGTGASVRAGEWATPGGYLLMPHGSGASSDLRVAGASIYLYENGQRALIENGFAPTWQSNPVIDISSSYHMVRMLAVPRWRRW